MISSEPSGYNQQQPQKQQQQGQFGRSMANTGKFSSFVARNNNNGNGVLTPSNEASTSAAAAAAAAAVASQFSNSGKQANSCGALVSSQQGKSANGNNMSLAKYKTVGPGGNEELMQLSTALVTESHPSYRKRIH